MFIGDNGYFEVVSLLLGRAIVVAGKAKYVGRKW